MNQINSFFIKSYVLLSLSVVLNCVIASKPVIAASSYYVRPTSCNNSWPGTVSQPRCTVTSGLSLMGSGDTLYLMAGAYNETVSISKSGITLDNYQNDTAKIDGNYTIPSGSNWSPLVNISGSNVVFRDIEVTRSNGAGIDVLGTNDRVINIYAHHNHEAGILLIGDDGVADGCRIYYNSMHNENGQQLSQGGGWGTGISACRHPSRAIIRNTTSWNNWGEGISTFGADHTILEDNISYDNWSVNMYIQNVQYALIQRNLVYRTPNNLFTQPGVQDSQGREGGLRDDYESGDAQYGISANNTYVNNFVMGAMGNFVHDDSSHGMNNALIANNTFINSVQRPNIKISGTSTNVQLRNNIIVQDDSLSIENIGGGINKSNNLWSKSPASGLGTNDFVANPLLAKTGSFSPGQLTGNWFKITTGSPAINQALSLVSVTEDYFRNPRGNMPDIGGHEFLGTAVSPSPTTIVCWGADNIINADDIKVWAINFLANVSPFDIIKDNKINSLEYGFLLSHWGIGCRH